MYRCGVCQDVGWLGLPPGTKYETVGGDAPLKPVKAVATASGPGAVTRCKGPRSQGCPFERWKRDEARKKAAREGKQASGDQAAV